MKTNVYFTGRGSGQMPKQGALHQSGSGGGARVTERDAHKVEPRSFAVSPEAVSRYGTAQGTHITGGGGREVANKGQSFVTGPGLMNAGPRPCGAGPGAGRDIQRTGTQGTHGPVAGTPFQASHRGWEYPGPGVRK
jgi:hypothetical protein